MSMENDSRAANVHSGTDSARRSRYLDALGIDRWVLREHDARGMEAVAEAEPAHVEVVAGDESAPEREAVAEAPGWEALQALVRDCTRCGLHQGRTHAVFGAGVREADLMVLGEAPGADEDRLGEAFVGRAGKLLDAMLKAIGRDRHTAVFITNIVKCRPPGNRDPAPDEAAACRPYLERQIELVRPRAILVLGRVAAQNLLASDEPVGRMRGRVHRYGVDGIPAVVSYHPAYLLRRPGEKRKSWDDLKLIRRVMTEAP